MNPSQDNFLPWKLGEGKQAQLLIQLKEDTQIFSIFKSTDQLQAQQEPQLLMKSSSQWALGLVLRKEECWGLATQILHLRTANTYQNHPLNLNAHRKMKWNGIILEKKEVSYKEKFKCRSIA